MFEWGNDNKPKSFIKKKFHILYMKNNQLYMESFIDRGAAHVFTKNFVTDHPKTYIIMQVEGINDEVKN